MILIDANKFLIKWNITHNKKKMMNRFFINESTKSFIINNDSKYEIIKGKNTKNGRTPDIINMDENLFNYFKMWVNGVSIKKHDRKEDLFFAMLEKLTSIKLIKQYNVKDYRIDAVYVNNKKIIIFEFNEIYHKNLNVMIHDDYRRKIIIEQLNLKFNNIVFLEIPEELTYKFLSSYVLYNYGISDKLNDFIVYEK